MAPTKKQETQRKTLTLNEKVAVIKEKQQSGIGGRALAKKYGVGKTQIQSIIKDQMQILADFENNNPLEQRRKLRKTGNEEINKLTWEWFKDMSSRKVPISGPLLQERALLFAKDLDNAEFKASNGWLESFQKRHNITFVTRSGERGDVPENVVKDWKEKLASLCEGYRPEDIFNMDETGLCFRVTENKTLFEKGQDCPGGKKSKLRLTISLCSSMMGEKMKPLIIWKYANPRCFKNINKNNLPVDYFSNKNAWMTSGVFETWLKAFDRKMMFQKRKILLFLDNATSHAEISLKNIKLQFFPANTTSILQPMDQGIIQTTKIRYRKIQLQNLITRLEKEKEKCCSELLKEVDILQAIYWVKNAWEAVLPQTITKCFAKCGFKTSREGIMLFISCILYSILFE